MKKVLIILIILLNFYVTAFSQESAFFELINDSSIKLFIDETGELTHKSNAKYYRCLKFENKKNHEGYSIKDYNLNNILLFQCKSVKGNLNDTGYFYYDTGDLKEKGCYKNGMRFGKWSYYYKNNQLKKVLEFSDKNEVLIWEFYSRKGKPIIANGYGKYKDDCLLNFRNPEYVRITGKVENGYKEGLWQLTYFERFVVTEYKALEMRYDVAERYNKGKFIKGTHSIEEKTIQNFYPFSLSNTDTKNKSALINVVDFNLHEHINFLDSQIGVNNTSIENNIDKEYFYGLRNFLSSNIIRNSIYFENTLLQVPKYKGKQNLNVEFLPNLAFALESLYKGELTGLNYVFLGFKISNNGIVENIDLIDIGDVFESNIKVNIENLCLNYWTPAINSENQKTSDCYAFIPIIFNNDSLEIGAYNFGFQNDFFDLSKFIDK